MSDLWCVHVMGPDSIIAQPDFWTAAERAHKWSATMLERHRVAADRQAERKTL